MEPNLDGSTQADEERGADVAPLPGAKGPWLGTARGRSIAVALALAAILALGGYLRLVGLDWDEGQHLHPDERFLTMVENALSWPQSLGEYLDTSLNPLNPYNEGQGSFVYGLLPVMLAKFIGQMTGYTGYSGVYLAGRAMSAVLDLLAVGVVFYLGRRLYDVRVGLLGALLLALSVLNIQQSHYFTVDSATTFLVTLALYMAVRVAQGKGWGSLFGLGITFGLALAAKISVATFLLIIGLALLVRLFGDSARRARSARTLREHSLRLGRWRWSLTVDGGEPPASIRRLDGLALRWLKAAALMLLVLFVAFWAFRLTQPQAFEGPGLFGIKLNQAWLSDMQYIQKLMSGEIDYPPSHQWAARAPILYMLQNMIRWGLGVPLGLAVWFAWGLMGWQLVRRGTLAHLLPWTWMSVTFFYQSVQFVKTVRYLLPIYPTMALMAAYGLVWLWDRGRASQRRTGRSWAPATAAAIMAVVVAGTALWAVSFASIYTRSVTRVAASRWIYANIPVGSAITFEVWDDALPLNLDGHLADQLFTMVRTDPYWEDIPEKRDALYQWLDEADYIVFSSNRLYGSIPRLADRYPMTTRYYEALFSGELGFEVVATFTSRPTILGVEIVDDSADESFTVYDHPRVTILKKTSAYSSAVAHQLFDGYDLDRIVRIMPKQVTGAPNELMLTDAEARIQRQGGTWSELFQRGSLANRIPAPLWYACMLLLGLIAFPLAYPMFRRMPDAGWLLSRTLGLLLFGYAAWLPASLGVLTFSRGELLLALVVLAGLAVLAAWRQRGALRGLVRERWRLLLACELLFLAAFVAMLCVRWGNPDLWHAAMGGEKPMDFAYLNAVIKSSVFPPYDPWFSGGDINYYYFGWVPIASIIKLTGILPSVGYNLALASLFALVVGGSAATAMHLVRPLGTERPGWPVRRLRWGVLAGLLVAVAGNLGEIELLWQGLAEIGRRLGTGIGGELGDVARGLVGLLAHGEALAFRPEWWYWNATRIMAHGEINEFPFFSFLYGDLHAHVMAMPLFVLCIGLAAVLATGGRREGVSRAGWRRWIEPALLLASLALVLGASWCANAWDLPTGYALALGALVIRARSEGRAWDRKTIVSLVGCAGALGVLARLLYLPFHSRYGAAYSSITLWTGDRSTLGDLSLIYLPFLFVLVTCLCVAASGSIRRSPWWRSLALGLASHRRFARGYALRQALVRYPSLLYSVVWAALAISLAVALLLVMLGESVSAILSLLLALGVIALLARRVDPSERFLRLMIAGGLALVLGTEWVVLVGDVGRMNTVFKFSLQAWVLWGISAAVALSALSARVTAHGRPIAQRAWWRVLLALLACGMFIYPALATGAKIRDRIATDAPHSLDGMAYMDYAKYADNGQDLTLSYDARAIRWLQENVAGSPVIVEANTPLYRWGGRISVYTGLPSVIGWDWHQKQQRAALSSVVVDWRLQDLSTIYNGTDIAETVELLQRYQVGLIYVGELERAYYSPEGLAKFDAMVGDTLERVYSDGPVTIYRVLGSGAQLVTSASDTSSLLDAAADWWAAHWIPSRVAADGVAADALVLDTPVDELPSVSARGWNSLAEGSAAGAAICWWLVLTLIGLVAWPLVAPLAETWADRGYLLARGVGLVVLSYLTWLGASLRWWPHTPLSLWVTLAILALLGWLLYRKTGTALRVGRAVLVSEAIFAASYLAFVVIRLLNPDLWQPWYGGEKMMEIAMLNAISKSAYMPPYDPYFAGGVLNYYYFGLYMVSTLCKLVGVSPEVGFNLAVPTFFALTTGTAYAIGREILGSGRLRVWQGACPALLVAVAGNLSGIKQYVEQISLLGCQGGAGSPMQGIVCAARGIAALVHTQGASLPFDYWYAATRIIPYTINEFPFFTFLFADLHPHLIALPFGLLALALCGLLLQARNARRALPLVLLIALTIGLLGVTNTWDMPIYLLIAGAVLLYVGQRRGGLRGALLGAGAALGVGLVAFVAYAPFYTHFQAQNLGIGLVSSTERTGLPAFFEIWGPFAWLLAGALIWQLRLLLRRLTGDATGRRRMAFGALCMLGVAAVLGTDLLHQVWPLLLLALLLAGATCLAQWRAPRQWFALLCITAALGVLAGLEWVYVIDFLKGSDWRRMNTVFKFSMQAWVLLGIGLGALLPVVWRYATIRRSVPGGLWQAGAAVLLLGALVYPLAAVPVRVNERFPSGSPARNRLDGTAYMAEATYDAPNGSEPVQMADDRLAIEWIWVNVTGTPVIAEAPVGFYREGGLRIASYTGLPTLVGAHEYEQRPAAQVAPRQADAELLYTSDDPAVALEIIARQQVDLVYVGALERALYAPEALAKFDALVDAGDLERVYAHGKATIYRVVSSAEGIAS